MTQLLHNVTMATRHAQQEFQTLQPETFQSNVLGANQQQMSSYGTGGLLLTISMVHMQGTFLCLFLASRQLQDPLNITPTAQQAQECL